MTSAERKALLSPAELRETRQRGRDGRVVLPDEVHGGAARPLAPHLRRIEERAASEADFPVDSSKRKAARRAASCLWKYLSTTFEAGGAPAFSWSSAQIDDWDRPPAVWFAWA